MIGFFKDWRDGIGDCWTLFGFMTIAIIPFIPFMILADRYRSWRNTPSRKDTLCMIYDKTHDDLRDHYVPDLYTLGVLQALKDDELVSYSRGMWRTTQRGDRLVIDWMNDEF